MNRRIPTPAQFLNRELGMLAFNRRVLAQAADDAVPLLERLRFITIVSSNLDEFFEIRVAGLKETDQARPAPSPGPTAARAGRGLRRGQPRGARAGRRAVPAAQPDGAAGARKRGRRASCGARSGRRRSSQWIRDYFFRELLPVLTPIGLDPGASVPARLQQEPELRRRARGPRRVRPQLGRRDRAGAARAAARDPPAAERRQGAQYAFVFLSSILHAHVGELFAGMNVLGCYQFRVTRNSDLFVDEEEIKNLHTALQGELLHRHFGDAVRLEVADNCSQRMVEFLLQQFGLQDDDLYRVDGPVNLYRMREVPDQVNRPDLKYPPFQPGLPPALDTRRSVRGAEEAGRAAAPPVPVVPAGDRFHPHDGRAIRTSSPSSRPCTAPAPTRS